MNFINRIQLNSFNFLFAVNIILFAAALLIQLSFNQGIDRSGLILLGGFVSTEILSGSFWLMLTANFLHISFIHFLVNMYAFKRIGEVVRAYYGDKYLFLTYIIGGIAASLATLLFSGYAQSIGASGSILALFGLLIGGTLRRRRFGGGLPFELKDFLPTLVITFSLAFIPGLLINHYAHFGGLATGILLGYILSPTIGSIVEQKERKFVDILYLISVVFFVISFAALVLNFIRNIFI